MEKYRKEDSYYEDQYDRRTIEILKKLESENKTPLKFPEKKIKPNENSKISAIISSQYNPLTPFYEEAVFRARNRESAIRQTKWDDEEKDRLINRYPEPENVKCNTCNCRMHFSTHIFNEKDKILFVFECPKGHKPRRAFYSNGDEYFPRKRTCIKCRSEDITTSVKKTKKFLKTKEICNFCGHITEDVFDVAVKSEVPITEKDRNKYCIDFINSRTILEEIKSLADLHDLFQKDIISKKLKDQYKVDEIEKINFPQLEERLIKLTEEHKFKRLQFQSPEIGRNVTVGFSIQDSTNRTDKESKKMLIKIIQEHLAKTNWRLMSPDNLSYRLGILGGKLKAYETDDDLLLLAKQLVGKLK